MQERRPSQTASFVALARALAHDGFTTVPGFVDPFARRLLSPGWASAHRLISRGMRRADRTRRDRGVAQLDVIPMRVAAIDAELRAAVAAGCRQVVILGAGLDTRAFRLTALADVAVFEVDHPATQAYKRRKSASLRPLARSISFVSVDFERRSLMTRLNEAGFRSGEPTAWVWEGVVMYLSDEALHQTLEDAARCSAPGSVLLVHYHEPRPRSGREHRIRQLVLSVWREPQIGDRAPEVMRDAVSRAGFDVVSDTRPSEWARRLGATSPSGETAAITHLLVARMAKPV
jgi:methyltransferase (TIGR00027 family)